MSNKRIIKRRRFNVLKFIIFIFLVYIFITLGIKIMNMPIKNIIILNNNILTDEEIIESGKLENYPSFIKTSTSSVCKKIKSIDLIKECDITRKLGYVFEIDIDEYKILYQVRSNGSYVLENGKLLENSDKEYNVPVLINYITDDVKRNLDSKLSLIDSDIISKISEIEYSPTKYDENRFIIYMLDGNMVYITLNKIKNLNKYNDIKKELEGHTGVLNLDSGNYFEIKN